MVKVSHKYSPIVIDNDWGSVIEIDLKNTDLVTDYDLVVVPGTEEIVPHLEKYQFFAYEFDTEERHIVRLNLQTDELEIVE